MRTAAVGALDVFRLEMTTRRAPSLTIDSTTLNFYEGTTLRHFHLAASFVYLLVILATPLRYTAAALTTGGANGSAATTSSTLRSDAAFTAAAMAALLPAAGPRLSRD